MKCKQRLRSQIFKLTNFMNIVDFTLYMCGFERYMTKKNYTDSCLYFRHWGEVESMFFLDCRMEWLQLGVYILEFDV